MPINKRVRAQSIWRAVVDWAVVVTAVGTALLVGFEAPAVLFPKAGMATCTHADLA